MPLKTEELGAERKKSPRGAGKQKAESVPAGGVIPSPVEHAAYLHALTENNPLGIVVLDLTHRIQMCNPAFERLFGYRQAEILGAELDSLLAPRDAKWEAAELSRQAAAGTVVREKAKRMRSDGSLVDVHILGVPILVEGKLIGSFGMYEDITKRRLAEKAQLEAEERFRSLFENAIEGIFQTTTEGRYLSVNPALARIFGFASPCGNDSERAGYGRGTLCGAGRAGRVQAVDDGARRGEGFEYEVRRKDGAKIWISENAHVVRGPDGKILSYEGTVEDITVGSGLRLERQATLEITHAVNVTENLEDLLRLIHVALKKVLYAENCFVALYEPASGMFHFPFFADQFDTAPPPQTVGRSCTAYVFAPAGPLRFRSRHSIDSPPQAKSSSSAPRRHPGLGVPLRSVAATIGVLVVQHYTDSNAYTERDLEFLESVGGQIALAIERQRSEETLRDSEARLRVLVEQLPAILWTVDSDLRFTSALGAGLTRVGVRRRRDRRKTHGRFLRDVRPRRFCPSPSTVARSPARPAHFTWSGAVDRTPATWKPCARQRPDHRRDLHGARCFRPQEAGSAVAPSAENGSRRSSRRRHRARFQ